MAMLLSSAFASLFICMQAKKKCQNLAQTGKHHPNSEIWWGEHHDVGLPCCLWTWTTCHCDKENEFPGFSIDEGSHRVMSECLSTI